MIISSVGLASYTIDIIRRSFLKLLGLQETSARQLACFLSHDWGTDELGRSNHERVAAVNRALCQSGLLTWFDSERMTGDINAAMTSGIDRSQTVVIFVTRNYLLKAAGLGPRGQDDNCLAEFSYSLNRRGVQKMIAVVMEPSCLNTAQWHGVVGLRLGQKLYVDLSRDGDAFDRGLEHLEREIRSLVGGGGQWMELAVVPSDRQLLRHV